MVVMGGKFWKLGGFSEIKKILDYYVFKKMKLTKKFLRILKILEIRENEEYGIIKNMGGGIAKEAFGLLYYWKSLIYCS